MRLMAAQSKLKKTKRFPTKFVPSMGIAQSRAASLAIDEPMIAKNQTKATMTMDSTGITMLAARKLNHSTDSMDERNCREPTVHRV